MKTETISEFLERGGKVEKGAKRAVETERSKFQIFKKFKEKRITKMKPFEENKLITIQEACDFLSIKKSRMYYMIHRKEIPHIKMGASLRFELNELKKWVKENSVKVGG